MHIPNILHAMLYPQDAAYGGTPKILHATGSLR